MKLLYLFMILILTVFFHPYQQDTIFTCTTYFDYEKEDKWKPFCKGIDSILQHHDRSTLNRIGRWLIVNEYSDQVKADWAHQIKQRYPFMTFVQKSKEEKGQAHSLNFVLEHIHSYTYWIQWEEAWFTEKECLSRGLSIMERTDITQLQMTTLNDQPDWLEKKSHSHYYMECNGSYCRIHYSPRSLQMILDWPAEHIYKYPQWRDNWPLYSLRPSINRISFYTIGSFRTEPELWPVKFEWEFGRRWVQHGAKKGVLPDGPVKRSKTHKSTYK